MNTGDMGWRCPQPGLVPPRALWLPWPGTERPPHHQEFVEHSEPAGTDECGARKPALGVAPIGTDADAGDHGIRGLASISRISSL